MSNRRQKRVRDVFHRALEQPSAEWSSFLEGACPDDEELRLEVLELLDSHGRLGGFLDVPAVFRRLEQTLCDTLEIDRGRDLQVEHAGVEHENEREQGSETPPPL